MKKFNLEEFIKKSKEIHGFRYDYSRVIYKNSREKIEIVCNIHGAFFQTPTSHIHGKNGCIKCSGKELKTTEKFINQAKFVHKDKYKYDKVVYKNTQTKVCITCIEHGDFWQTPHHHLKGFNCSLCGINSRKKNNTSNTEDFLKKAVIVHKNKYNYDKVNYLNSKNKIEIVCETHGVFSQSPTEHLSGCGCPKCNSSKGENKIRCYLIDNNIYFEEQKKFPDCRNLRSLPFDFYIPDLNILIEYQGELHFYKMRIKNKNLAFEKLQRTKQNDQIKKEWCENNNIKLLEILYTDYNEIENILNNLRF